MAERSKTELKRVFQRLSPEEQQKARQEALAQAHKSMKHDTTNREFAASAGFIKMCESHQIKPTSRQASKYRGKCGSLYKAVKGA